MLKGLLAFGLTRRPIILLCLLAFVGGGLVAFSKLNIEAYPNPAPVILEITAQGPHPVSSAAGIALDGDYSGRAGIDFTAVVRRLSVTSSIPNNQAAAASIMAGMALVLLLRPRKPAAESHQRFR